MSSPSNSSPLDADSRLEALELKIMDLEHGLHQLNEVVVNQYRDIERMRRGHQQLQGQLAAALEGRTDGTSQGNPVGNPVGNPEGNPAGAPSHEVPPHY